MPQGAVVIVRATKKLRQRLPSATAHDSEPPTTMLGEWYATLLPWRPKQLCRFGPTASRSVFGILNEFSFLADG